MPAGTTDVHPTAPETAGTLPVGSCQESLTNELRDSARAVASLRATAHEDWSAGTNPSPAQPELRDLVISSLVGLCELDAIAFCEIAGLTCTVYVRDGNYEIGQLDVPSLELVSLDLAKGRVVNVRENM